MVSRSAAASCANARTRSGAWCISKQTEVPYLQLGRPESADCLFIVTKYETSFSSKCTLPSLNDVRWVFWLAALSEGHTAGPNALLICYLAVLLFYFSIMSTLLRAILQKGRTSGRKEMQTIVSGCRGRTKSVGGVRSFTLDSRMFPMSCSV